MKLRKGTIKPQKFSRVEIKKQAKPRPRNSIVNLDNIDVHRKKINVDMENGRCNAYRCDKCDKFFVTVDIDEGVTPFTIPCQHKPCKGTARSSFYKIEQTARVRGLARGYWVKTKRHECLDLVNIYGESFFV